MKTVISIPDDLLAAADALAAKLAMSRSGLMAAALAADLATVRLVIQRGDIWCVELSRSNRYDRSSAA